MLKECIHGASGSTSVESMKPFMGGFRQSSKKRVSDNSASLLTLDRVVQQVDFDAILVATIILRPTTTPADVSASARFVATR